MTLDTVLSDPPPFHTDERGDPISWGLPADVLRFIASELTDMSRTLETGAGLSTVVFALAHAHHACVVPDAEQVERIRAYCHAHGIATDRLTFHIAPSEEVLPTLPLRDLDLVLIDGRHGFPAPFIDWYYTAAGLKAGGLVIVDDTQLWTGSVLKDFLLEEPDWRLERSFSKTVVFRKLREGGHAREWTTQPFVVRQSAQMVTS